MIIDLKELNKRIKDFRENAEPQKLILGYKTYSKLMKEDSFVDMLRLCCTNLSVKGFSAI